MPLYNGDRVWLCTCCHKDYFAASNLVAALFAFLPHCSFIYSNILQPTFSYLAPLVQTGTARGYSDMLDAKIEPHYQLPY